MGRRRIAPLNDPQGVIHTHGIDGVLEYRCTGGHRLFRPAIHGRFQLIHVTAKAKFTQRIGHRIGSLGQLQVHGPFLGQLVGGHIRSLDQGFFNTGGQLFIGVVTGILGHLITHIDPGHGRFHVLTACQRQAQSKRK